jgi:5-methylcytosine-specific restriction endonuclease McrA
VRDQTVIKPSQAIDQAFDQNHCREPRRAMAKKQMESSYLQAKLWGLFTPENCDRLKRGNAGLITKGSYIGQIAEVDHIVPVSRYSQFANELANLQLMPAMQNRSKGNRMGAAELEKLKELQSLLPTSFTRK